MRNQPPMTFSLEPGGWKCQAVDWFIRDAAPQDPAVAVVGYGEGAVLALCAAAADPRIDAALVSGYFQGRQRVWEEPIYRNVWSFAA